MANDLPPWGVDTEIPDDWFRPRWWFWVGLIGMMVGWFVGLYVKPDVHDIHRAALDLVPPSAEIIEETVEDVTWVLLAARPPSTRLHLDSDSEPVQLSLEIATRAELNGWREVNAGRNFPDALKFETFSMEAFINPLVRESRDYDASITVDTPFGLGKLITGAWSLMGGLVAAVFVGWATRTRQGRRPYRPIRWWNVLGVVCLVPMFLIALWFVP